MKLKAFKINNSSSVFVPISEIRNQGGYNYFYINGEDINVHDSEFVGIVLSSDDNFQYKSKSKIVKEYVRGDEAMSIKEYRSVPTCYDEDSSEEQVLNAISRRRELEGFNPVYIDAPIKDVEIEINGSIENTGSRFIKPSFKSDYSQSESIYTVNGKDIAIDEFDTLAEKYKDHATFYNNKNYLEYAKINGNYAFDNSIVFSERTNCIICTSLNEAQKEEENIRNKVRLYALRHIFKKDKLTEYKASQILERLNFIANHKTLKSMKESIAMLAKDLERYIMFTIKNK